MTSSRFNQPWYSTATKRICRRKARAFKKARRTNRDRDWKRYRRLKKQTQLTCRQAYNQYLTNIICSEPGGGKRLGALIKAKRCEQTGTAPLKEGNLLHSDPKTKANILNRQFASVFTNDSSSQLPDLGPSPHPGMHDIHVQVPGIIKLLANLKPHKATGPDGIPAKLLKESAVEIAPAIALLFQASLNQGRVPSTWDKTLVVPIFKKGNRSSPANYRPISLTAILCKLCEHVVHCAIINHLTEHKILSDAQHGSVKDARVTLNSSSPSMTWPEGWKRRDRLISSFLTLPKPSIKSPIDFSCIRSNTMGYVATLFNGLATSSAKELSKSLLMVKSAVRPTLHLVYLKAVSSAHYYSWPLSTIYQTVLRVPSHVSSLTNVSCISV